MNILYALNDKFVPQTAASITSVCENNRSVKDIHFYLFAMEVSPENQKLLENHLKTYHRKLTFIEIKDLKTYFNFDFDTNGWNPIVLARLLVGELLPKNLDKILYLDGDTIIRSNLAKLWKTDLTNHAIAASIEPTVDKRRKSSLGLDGYPYYNAGVLLIDLKNWRRQNIGTEIIDFYQAHSGQLFANDQDAINGSQKGKIYTLSPKYNYSNIFDQYSYRFLTKLCDFPYISYQTFEAARQNPTIIHYLGEERPWRVGNSHKYRDDYLKYLNLTPWKNQNLEPGWQIYFLCWNFFNKITKPFPGLRYSIINSLIPTVMKYRSRSLAKNQEK